MPPNRYRNFGSRKWRIISRHGCGEYSGFRADKMTSKETCRCWAEIDRSALLHNLSVVRERISPADVLAVVKANAYGHGLVGVAETLASEVQFFGVANLQEELAVR